MQIHLTNVSGFIEHLQCILRTILGALTMGEGRRGTEASEDGGGYALLCRQGQERCPQGDDV